MAQNERKKKKASSGDSMRTILYVVLVVVGIAGAVALGTSGGSSDTTTDTVVTVPGGVQPAEYQKVSSTGGLLAPLPESGADTETGKSVAVLKGYDLQGRPVTIDPAGEGKATMVVFLAHWCPHCNREIPVLNKWRESGEVPTGLRVVGITTGSKADQANWPPSKWMTAMKWPFEVMADSEAQEAAAAYGVAGYPFIAFVGANGKITARTSGEIPVEQLQIYANGAVAAK
ncbi:MAG: TlpA disulfide reductase family protein [Actinobacteria bacterium]|nr:TlpA disulfide reductase family protein [Actinomycetota bacterium]